MNASLPSQRIDQLIHLVGQVLHLALGRRIAHHEPQQSHPFAVRAALAEHVQLRVHQVRLHHPHRLTLRTLRYMDDKNFGDTAFAELSRAIYESIPFG